MVELIVLIKFMNANAAHAIARGRAPGIAKVYTVVLWFWFEVMGFFIGAAICDVLGWSWRLSLVYLLAALPMAFIGGFISSRIAKRGKPFYTPPQ